MIIRVLCSAGVLSRHYSCEKAHSVLVADVSELIHRVFEMDGEMFRLRSL